MSNAKHLGTFALVTGDDDYIMHMIKDKNGQWWQMNYTVACETRFERVDEDVVFERINDGKKVRFEGLVDEREVQTLAAVLKEAKPKTGSWASLARTLLATGKVHVDV